MAGGRHSIRRLTKRSLPSRLCDVGRYRQEVSHDACRDIRLRSAPGEFASTSRRAGRQNASFWCVRCRCGKPGRMNRTRMRREVFPESLRGVMATGLAPRWPINPSQLSRPPLAALQIPGGKSLLSRRSCSPGIVRPGWWSRNLRSVQSTWNDDHFDHRSRRQTRTAPRRYSA